MKRVFLSFNQKPFLVSSSSSLQVDETKFQVYLDINNTSRLEGYYFSCPKESDWFIYFESLAKDLERVHLKDIPKVVELWKSVNKNSLSKYLFILPLALLDNALSSYNGTSLGHSEVSSNLSSNLICRCFGVYSNQIEDLVTVSEDPSLVTIASELKATIGCGSCSNSVIEVLNKAKSKLVNNKKLENRDLKEEFNLKGERVLPLGMNPSEFVLKVNSMLESWKKDQELSKVKFEIMSMKGHTFEIKIEGTSNSKYILETFSDYINDRLGTTIRFNLFL
jgi:NifU-like protein